MRVNSGGVKKVAIFGSTGSIGCSTLDVVRQHSDASVVIKNESKLEALQTALSG